MKNLNKRGGASAGAYLHPHGRWFTDALPPKRRVAEHGMTRNALAAEFGQNHAMTLIAGSWAAVVSGVYASVEQLEALAAAEDALRGLLSESHSDADRYALACNLATQGFAFCCLESWNVGHAAAAKMEEAFALASICKCMHPMDILKIIEELAGMRVRSGCQVEAISLLHQARETVALNFRRFPRECYDVLGLWVEFSGDAQLQRNARRWPASTPQSASAVKSIVVSIKNARAAARRGDKETEESEFGRAVLQLMDVKELDASVGARLAEMITTQAVRQHASQKLRFVKRPRDVETQLAESDPLRSFT